MAESESRLRRRLARRRRWAASMIGAERGLDAFAPAFALIAGFLAVSLLGGWAHLPWWLHAAALVAVAGALVWTLVRGRRRFRAPAASDVDRRLESAAGLAHRPIASLGDRPAGGEGPAARLWAAHQARQRSALDRLRFVGPAPVLARRDPWALRTALVLGLVVAVVDAGGDWRARLLDALVPTPARADAVAPARVDLWVTPPAYTDQPPVVRSYTLPVGVAPEALVVAERSELVVQVHDPALDAPPAPSYGLEDIEAERLGAGSVEARLTLLDSGALAIPAGDGEEPRLRVDVEVINDNPPNVAFAGRPEVTVRKALHTRFAAEDDIGLAAIALELTVVGRPDSTERVNLREFGRPVTELADGSFVDLTPHPFAGQEVTARLVASDVVAQEGTSGALELTLPERDFTNPLARAIIALRKQLVAQPTERRAVASKLNILAQSPRLDQVEVAIPLTLRAASTRLVLHAEGAADRSVVDLLWELALYVEDGQMAVAERDLRELQEALREALERGADADELERLMDELEQAMNAFLDAMQRQAMEQLRDMDPRQLERLQPVDPNARSLERQDLQEMLDQMREAMQSGAREQAEQMLSQLQRMMENLQAAMQMPQMSPMQEKMGALQELIQRQQELMDRSFDAQRRAEQQQPGQQGQQGQAGQGGQAGAQGLGGEQEALRRALGELMRRLGESGQDIPRALGQSELQMRDAEQALGQGRPGQATRPQGEALDLLQQGAGQLMEQMQQQMMGEGPGRPGNPQGLGPPLRETRDPLGRPQRNDGGASPFGVEVPDRPDLGTAREVLRELQRRSGDSDRPALELDYLERLLERF